jgi:hypothetical protein
MVSHSQSDRVRAHALGATDWSQLLISSATASAAYPRQLWREKHEVLNWLISDRSGSANVEDRH